MHSLPIDISKLVHKSEADLKTAYQTMSRAYEQGTHLKQNYDLESYVVARLPATYAMASEITAKIDSPINSLLDLGAGPGSLSLGALDHFDLETVHLVEENPDCMAMAGRIFELYKQQTGRNFELYKHTSNLSVIQDKLSSSYDLVGLGHVLNELSDSESGEGSNRASWQAIVTMAFEKAHKALVLFDPGTPKNYQLYTKIRRHIKELGGHIKGPCPHELECPLLERPQDWCHFQVKVERSPLHQAIKGGSLAYEIEKMCYLIITKVPENPPAVILSNPQKKKGHIHFKVCGQDGKLHGKTTTKKSPMWQQSRKWQWGDSFMDD
jgi:ribosomal protein RSM22 (predicted rRNA methylase)